MPADDQALRAELEAAREEADRLRAQLRRVEQSVTWNLLQGASRRLYPALGGDDSRAGRTLQRSLRMVGRRSGRNGSLLAPERAWIPLALPTSDEPVASIVLPVHSAVELTERCLHAIAAATTGIPYEVIVVDDDADADTKGLLGAVRGARVLVNEENLGYLGSVNRGAATARGRHLVLLNSDTEPQPGWLEALVERAESADDVGVVGARLIYPDGRLQEAGGIVFRDGTPANYGWGREPWDPAFSYAREIDYASAAALLVRAEVWRALGGFDERFAPGYFEDTDLCFGARELGWRVLYEPRALVLHVEGASHGSDPASGVKRHQELNRPTFAEKWAHRLVEQLPADAPHAAYRASDRRRGPWVLVADHRVPRPDCDSGSLRMQHLLEELLDLGCRVTFVPDDFWPTEPYTEQLQALGIEVLHGPVHMRDRLEAIGPQLRLAILSRPTVVPRYLPALREVCPQARIAYDTVDLHFVRESRRAATTGEGGDHIVSSFRELELGMARACDATLVVSEAEREHLAELDPALEILVVPNVHRIAGEPPGPDGRAGLLFVGGFEHMPNVDAVAFLASEIMPRVWEELPEAELTIVGPDAPPEVHALARPGIVVAGWVPDLDPLLEGSRVMVAPLRFGAGMKGKVTQSLAAGLPVVATTVAAEGLGAQDGRELHIADDPAEFARRVVALHGDDDAWWAMSRSGRELARRTVSPDLSRAALERLLA
jgi:GT2 family glycosyltransferase